MTETMKNLADKADDTVDRLNFIVEYLRPIGNLAHRGECENDELNLVAAGAIMITVSEQIEKISEELYDLVWKLHCEESMEGAKENE